MSITAKGNIYEPAPAGWHQGICADLEDLGETETKYGKKRRIKITWELDKIKKNKYRFTVSRTFTLSLNDKAALRAFLESWYGRALTEEEIIDGIDLEEALLDRPCIIEVTHNIGDNGKTYANVSEIQPANPDTALWKNTRYIRKKDRPEYAGPASIEEAAEEMNEFYDSAPDEAPPIDESSQYPTEENPISDNDIPF